MGRGCRGPLDPATGLPLKTSRPQAKTGAQPPQLHRLAPCQPDGVFGGEYVLTGEILGYPTNLRVRPSYGLLTLLLSVRTRLALAGGCGGSHLGCRRGGILPPGRAPLLHSGLRAKPAPQSAGQDARRDASRYAKRVRGLLSGGRQSSVARSAVPLAVTLMSPALAEIHLLREPFYRYSRPSVQKRVRAKARCL